MSGHTTGSMDNQLTGEIMEAIAPPPGSMLTAYDQLKPFEKQFVDTYLGSDSPMAAVKAIYPQPKGVPNDKYAQMLRVRAWAMVRRPLVQAAIADKLKQHASKWDLTTERVLGELAKIAYANIDDYIDRSTGEVKFDFSEDRVTRDQMAAVGEIKVEKTTTPDGNVTEKVTFKLHDKLGALEKAMKHLGLYAPERVQLQGTIRAMSDQPGREIITVDMTDDEAANAYGQFLLGSD